MALGIAFMVASSHSGAESAADFSAATGEGGIITNDGAGGSDARPDTVDIGRETSTSGTPGGGGGGSSAGRRDDSGSCSCTMDQTPGSGVMALALLLLALTRKKRDQ